MYEVNGNRGVLVTCGEKLGNSSSRGGVESATGLCVPVASFMSRSSIQTATTVDLARDIDHDFSHAIPYTRYRF